ncbi:MAG: 4-hydroxy-3-methylbut-2-enyl diphosphate reductase, partial [Nanoarchaeota archaeon]
SKVSVLGRLIHNPQEVKRLNSKGIDIKENLNDIDGGTVVITSHGVSDSTIELVKSKGYKVVDTTCPLVRSVHNITKNFDKRGYITIIYGDKEHVEVKGISGNLSKSIVIKHANQLTEIDQEQNYLLVSQTTMEIDEFNNVSEELKKKIRNLKVVDTICLPTKERQSSARELAQEVDMMIVVGGYMSSNTKKLSQVCSEYVETHHIERFEEINKEWFIGKEHIGITAGASTPDYVVNAIVEGIKNVG